MPRLPSKTLRKLLLKAKRPSPRSALAPSAAAAPRIHARAHQPMALDRVGLGTVAQPTGARQELITPFKHEPADYPPTAARRPQEARLSTTLQPVASRA